MSAGAAPTVTAGAGRFCIAEFDEIADTEGVRAAGTWIGEVEFAGTSLVNGEEAEDDG